MIRQAILIASSSKDDPIPGTYEDIQVLKQFLCSNEGGAWESDEIILRQEPSKAELIELVRQSATKNYVMVFFAGHGRAVKAGLPWVETEISINDTETILERELNGGAERCVIILDCCRPITWAPYLEPVAEDYIVMEKNGSLERAYFRCRYDDALRNVETGLVTIYSTSLGTGAADNHSFTQHLVFQLIQWCRAQENMKVITLPEAVFLAEESMKMTNSQQRPIYNGGRRRGHFPIGISQ